jgi:hypothetical protein
MTPRANITAWRAVAPWPSNEQVEQDLVISRAQFEVNLQEKLESKSFLEDIRLLIHGDRRYNPAAAGEAVRNALIAELPARS